MPIPSGWHQRLTAFVNEWKENPHDEKYLGDQTFGQFVLTEQAASWDGFLERLNELQGSWCFQGQQEPEGVGLAIEAFDLWWYGATETGHSRLLRLADSLTPGLAFRLLCLPHLRPSRFLSLRNLPPGGSGHRVFAIRRRRRISSIQFAQDRNRFVQLHEFLLCLCSLSFQHLDRAC